MIAAEAREFAGLMPFLDGLEEFAWGLDYAVSALGQGRRWVLAANGPGPRLARQAAAGALERVQGTVISTGFCGALDPSLAVGDIFVAATVLDAASGAQYGTGTPGGVLLSGDRVFVTAREKAELHESTGAKAVDMEAAAVAQTATEFGRAFRCVRVVSDAVDQDLPLDFNRYRDASGRFSKRRILSAALAHPFKVLPHLIQLDRQARYAARQLGEHLVHAIR